MKTPKTFVSETLQEILSLRTPFVTHDRLMFIPHQGMARNDRYNLMNWRSDNALTLAQYILSHDLQKDKILTIAVSVNDNLDTLNNYVATTYPGRKVEFVRFLGNISTSERWHFYRLLTESSHVFTSITYPLRPFSRRKSVTYVDLGYFPMPFKNDIFAKSDPLYMGLDRFNDKDLDYYICNSELAIRLIMPSMNVDYGHYLNLGNCRNDYLLSDEYPSTVRKVLEQSVDYPVKKIVLYTPTHRDYEEGQKEASRELLGYDMDLKRFGDRLKENGILIVCKLHPKQNIAAIKRSLPPSITIHQATEKYGLSELMKASDALLTDYTSGYYDYLLLDKPVIFNFHDVELYKSTRGFTFTPIESICAGEIVKDATGLEKALSCLDENADKFGAMRHFVKNLVYSYSDTGSTERIYNRFLSSDASCNYVTK